MELLNANLVNTTTQIVVQSNTALSENLFDPDKRAQYYTDGYNNDATTTTLRINFDSTQTISRIALIEHNLKSFQLYYNGATANSLSLSGPTTTGNFTTNSQTSHYLQLPTPINATSVSIDMRSTISANSEKAIGYLVLADQELDFSRIPNSSGYDPSLDPKQIVHNMSDGGTRLHVVRDKWNTKLKYTHIPESFRNQLRDVYDQHGAFIFVPFGTHTSWDGILFECVWVGEFGFYRYSDDASESGYSGTIDLRETAS